MIFVREQMSEYVQLARGLPLSIFSFRIKKKKKYLYYSIFSFI
jgi:hypothetical protein